MEHNSTHCSRWPENDGGSDPEGKIGISCSDLETKGVLAREECAGQGRGAINEGWALCSVIDRADDDDWRRKIRPAGPCCLPSCVWRSSASCCKILWHPLLSCFLFCFVFSLLKGAHVPSQGVQHSQEQRAYLILFKSQTQTFQEISRITQNWAFLGSCLCAGGAVHSVYLKYISPFTDTFQKLYLQEGKS